MTDGRATIDRLRRAADMFPERVALQDSRSCVTFQELEGRLAQVAASVSLARSHSGPIRFLPVVVDRTVESAVAVLACLTHRIPFFPIDAHADQAFASALLERAGAPATALVPTDAHPLPPRVHHVGIGADDTWPAPPIAGDDDEALVVFTSGSTGDPKGVVFDWHALDRRWHYRDSIAPPVRAGFGQPIVAPLDAMWGITLLADVAAGCSTLLVDPSRHRPIDFLMLVADFGPSHMPMPSQLGRILSQLPDDACVRLPTVTHLSVGSEGFRYEFFAGLRRIFADEALVSHNLATTEGGRVLHQEFPLGSSPTSGVVHVGLPAFPSDLRLRPVPDVGGDVFELVVGGAVALGYLDDPARTAERFSLDAEGNRWWSSGDLVAMTPEGTYRHLGRLDDIVKVRGKLASPSDVTAVLLQVPGIKAAITIPVQQDHAVRLVSHVELEPGALTTLDQVRGTLTARLPSHLQPSAVLRHENLPISDRGKIDRRALMDGPFTAWPDL